MSAIIEGRISDSDAAQPIGERHMGTLATVDGTPADVISVTPPANGTWLVEARVAAKNVTNAGEDAGYHLRGLFTMNAGTLAQVDTTTTDAHEHANVAAATDCAFAITGDKIAVKCTGKAAVGFGWSASMSLTPNT